MEKWQILDQNHGLTPLEKSQFFHFLNCCFYNLARRFFVLEYLKTLFHGLYSLKTKDGKMANLGPKPWVNPFREIAIFPLFERPVFIA